MIMDFRINKRKNARKIHPRQEHLTARLFSKRYTSSMFKSQHIHQRVKDSFNVQCRAGDKKFREEAP